MEVQLTAEQEAQLEQLATSSGTNPEALVQNAVLHMLDEGAQFFNGVRRAEAEFKRGDFLTHEQMGERIQRFLEP